MYKLEVVRQETRLVGLPEWGVVTKMIPDLAVGKYFLERHHGFKRSI